jgi:uncharacterized membrane protein (DUF2068 family)
MKPPMKSSASRMLRLIAAFKLLKGVLLIVVGISALKLIHTDIGSWLTEWVIRFGLDPGGRHVGRFLLKAAELTPNRLKEIGVGSLVYSALFLTEGIGLWLLKRWAEWLTVIITASLIPVEIYEIYRHLTPVRILLLLINVAVVAYLVHRIRNDRGAV